MIRDAEIVWKDNIPVSEKFGDIYFSKEGGAEETAYVFLQGNGLPGRWLNQKQFTVFEFGFGFGLNFIETWKEFERSGQGLLFYYSTEMFPVSRKDLQIFSEHYPDNAHYIQLLIENYPDSIPGYHRIQLTDRVCLTLLLGDAGENCAEFYGKVDAWYLDGFAPAKNPDMWSGGLFGFMQTHSSQGATFATYTAAGFVKRGLEECGFTVIKQTGFGKKKEMLAGHLTEAKPVRNYQPWFNYTSNLDYNSTVAVIGAGLAGTAVAESLHRRGVAVTLVDRDGIANGASGNLAGMLYPFLSASFTWYGRFSLESYGYLLRHLARKKIFHLKSGVYKLADEPEKLKTGKAAAAFGLREETVFFKENISAGNSVVAGGAVVFPDGSISSPPEICRKNLETIPGENILLAEVSSIQYENSKWHIYDHTGKLIHESDLLVLANAFETGKFSETEFIPMDQIKGQICYLTETEDTSLLDKVIASDGYILPSVQGVHVIGATYSENITDKTLNEKDSLELMEKANTNLQTEFFSKGNISGGRVSFRAQTRDRFPVIGAVPDTDWYYENYKSYPFLKDKSTLPESRNVPGLFITAGHGSRGLMNTHLGAELLAAIMFNEPMPVEKSIADELNPARFIMRNLKRQKFAP